MSIKYLNLLVGIILMSGCGQTASTPDSSGSNAKENQKDAVTQSPDGKKWLVQFKQCGAQSIQLSFPEEYRFDSGFVARISVSSDSPQQQCRQALVFTRTLTSTSSSSNPPVYQEKSHLQASQLRTVCRNKLNGVPVDPPVSDTTEAAAPTELELTLDLRRDVINAKIVGSSECQGTGLDLGLSKQ